MRGSVKPPRFGGAAPQPSIAPSPQGVGQTDGINPTPESDNGLPVRHSGNVVTARAGPQLQFVPQYTGIQAAAGNQSSNQPGQSVLMQSSRAVPSLLAHQAGDDPRTAPRVVPSQVQHLPKTSTLKQYQESMSTTLPPQPTRGFQTGEPDTTVANDRPFSRSRLPSLPDGGLKSILKKKGIRRVHFGPVTEILIPVKDELERLSFSEHVNNNNNNPVVNPQSRSVASRGFMFDDDDDASNSTQDSQIIDQLAPGGAPPAFNYHSAQSTATTSTGNEVLNDTTNDGGREDSTSTTDDVLSPRDDKISALREEEEGDDVPPPVNNENLKHAAPSYTIEEEPDLIAPSSASKGSRKGSNSNSLSISLEAEGQLDSTRDGLRPTHTNYITGAQQPVSLLSEEGSSGTGAVGSAEVGLDNRSTGVEGGGGKSDNSSQSYDNLFENYFKNTFGIMKAGWEEQPASRDVPVEDEEGDLPPSASKSGNLQVQNSSGGTNTTQGGSLSFCSLPLRQPSPPVAPSQQEKPLEVTTTQTVVDVQPEPVNNNEIAAPSNALPPESPSFVLPPRQLFNASQQLNASTTSLQEQQPEESQLVQASPLQAKTTSENRSVQAAVSGNDLLSALNGALNLPQGVGLGVVQGLDPAATSPAGNHGKEPPIPNASLPSLLPSSAEGAALMLVKPSSSQRDIITSTGETPTTSQLPEDGEKPQAQLQVHQSQEQREEEVPSAEVPSCRSKRGRESEESEEEHCSNEAAKSQHAVYRCAMCQRCDDVKPAVFKERKKRWEEENGAGTADLTPAGAVVTSATATSTDGKSTSSISPSRASKLELALREEGPEPAMPGMFTVLSRPKERGGDICIHQHCALWSPDCFFDDKKRLVGVEKEVTRSRDIKCAICRKPGASIGCCHPSCERSYHFPCALAASLSAGKSVKMFHSKMLVACRKHAEEVGSELKARKSSSVEGGNEQRTSTSSNTS